MDINYGHAIYLDLCELIFIQRLKGVTFLVKLGFVGK